MEKKIVLTRPDFERLKKYLSAQGGAVHLKQLAAEAENCLIVEPQEIEGAVVTMNSVAEVEDMKTGEKEKYKLVWPEDADVAEDKISVLAPLGAALIGYREGDEVELSAPAGVRRVKIAKVHYQPEAEGRYDL